MHINQFGPKGGAQASNGEVSRSRASSLARPLGPAFFSLFTRPGGLFACVKCREVVPVCGYWGPRV